MIQLHQALRAAGIPVVGVSSSPDGSIRLDFAPEATDEQRAQAAQIVASFDVAKTDHNEKIDQQIASLEATKPGYVRGVREFMLGVSQVLSQVPGTPDLMKTPGMQNVKALDDAISALRAQRQK